MSRTVDYTVDIDVDDVIDSLSDKEKRELYEQLGDELEEGCNITHDDNFDVGQYLSELSEYELKKVLCTALNVPSYMDEKALRERLEPIINAK